MLQVVTFGDPLIILTTGCYPSQEMKTARASRNRLPSWRIVQILVPILSCAYIGERDLREFIYSKKCRLLLIHVVQLLVTACQR